MVSLLRIHNPVGIIPLSLLHSIIMTSRHGTLSALPALCDGNPPATNRFHSQKGVC